MNHSGIFNRLEIDVMQANELLESVQLASKYSFPALVVHPTLATEAIIARAKFKGKFKIITPVDWPKGEIFGMTKFRGLSTDALEAEGFEFMLTPSKNETETRNEVKVITDFVKTHLNELTEVRFVLGVTTRDQTNIETMCKGLTKVRPPTLIRTDIGLKIQISKANPELHNQTVETIQKIINIPVKVSGNIGSIRTAAACHNAARLAVNLSQAKTIVREFQQQPDQLRELLKEEPVATEVKDDKSNVQ